MLTGLRLGQIVMSLLLFSKLGAYIVSLRFCAVLSGTCFRIWLPGFMPNWNVSKFCLLFSPQLIAGGLRETFTNFTSFLSEVYVYNGNAKLSRCMAYTLVGYPEKEITGARLPSNGQVLRTFFFHHSVMKQKSLRASWHWWKRFSHFGQQRKFLLPPSSTLRRCSWIWSPNMRCWRRIASGSRTLKKWVFVDDLKELSDVGHKDGLSMMTNEEDNVFLLSQREDRLRSSMSGKHHVCYQASSYTSCNGGRPEEESSKLTWLVFQSGQR